METYYDANDNRLSVTGVRGADGTAIADATVTVSTITDTAGNEVEGTYPIALEAGDTDGEYFVVLSDLDVTVGRVYEATVEVDSAGKHGEATLRFGVQERKV